MNSRRILSKPPTAPTTHERGIRRTRSGFQVYVRIKGEFRSKHFPPDTDIRDLRQWREEQKARHVLKLPDDPNATSFERDANTYLDLVKHLTSYRDRAHRVKWWVTFLGPRINRHNISALDIRRGLEQLRRLGKSNATLNLYRTALMHLYTVLDGKSGRNPVRDVPHYDEEPGPLILPTWATAEKVIARVGWVTNRDGSRRRDNLTRLRLAVLLYTGWPASTLMRLEPAHVEWKTGIVRLTARRKGRGVSARVVPVMPKALIALKALKKAKAWGSFDTRSMNKALRRACRALKVTEFHPYVLRHLFLTELALVTKDDRVVAELGLHSDTKQTRRYTAQSVDPRLKAGIAALDDRLATSATVNRKGRRNASVSVDKAETELVGEKA